MVRGVVSLAVALALLPPVLALSAPPAESTASSIDPDGNGPLVWNISWDRPAAPDFSSVKIQWSERDGCERPEVTIGQRTITVYGSRTTPDDDALRCVTVGVPVAINASAEALRWRFRQSYALQDSAPPGTEDLPDGPISDLARDAWTCAHYPTEEPSCHEFGGVPVPPFFHNPVVGDQTSSLFPHRAELCFGFSASSDLPGCGGTVPSHELPEEARFWDSSVELTDGVPPTGWLFWTFEFTPSRYAHVISSLAVRQAGLPLPDGMLRETHYFDEQRQMTFLNTTLHVTNEARLVLPHSWWGLQFRYRAPAELASSDFPFHANITIVDENPDAEHRDKLLDIEELPHRFVRYETMKSVVNGDYRFNFTGIPRLAEPVEPEPTQEPPSAETDSSLRGMPTGVDQSQTPVDAESEPPVQSEPSAADDGLWGLAFRLLPVLPGIAVVTAAVWRSVHWLRSRGAIGDR